MTRLNIGLNNNPYGAEEVINKLNGVMGDIPITFSVEMGEYEGNEEPTVVAVYESYASIEDLERLCEEMTQECIAIKVNGVGSMVFNPGYNGERFEFNDQYFI